MARGPRIGVQDSTYFEAFESMKHRVIGPLFIISSAVVLFSCAAKTRSTNDGPLAYAGARTSCGMTTDVSDVVSKLSSENFADADQARKELLSQSKTSVECRKEIVDTLIRTMDKPHLNFLLDRPSFFLWSNGSALLGELKAVEALDLLIDHLDLNDGSFSASMSHQPAVSGVKAMGILAVPKLGIALQHNSNPRIRLAAALCLTEIGGPDSLRLLNQGLGSEADPCVSRFVRISIDILNHEQEAKALRDDDKTLVGLKQKLIIAFRCNS